MFTIPELQSARQLKTFQLLDCPHCGEQLNRHGRLVVATRNCPACGRRVVAEPEDDGPPPFSREQFDDACAEHARALNSVAWVFLAGFVVLFFGIVAVTLYRDTISAAVQPIVEPNWFLLLVALGPCGVIFSAALVLLDRAARSGLKCPHCAAPCSATGPRPPNLTRFTGNCANCGRKLVELFAEPGASPAPLPTIDEFKSADRAVRADWSALLVLAAALALPTGLLLVTNPERFFVACEQRYDVMTAAVVASAVILIGGLSLFAVEMVALRWVARCYERKRAAEPALNCPHCRCILLPVSAIVAVRRCPKCRARVLADPEPVGVAGEPASG